MPKKDAFAEIARIMAQPHDPAIMAFEAVAPFDQSGSMEPVKSKGGTSYESVFAALRGQMDGTSPVDPGLDRLFSRLSEDAPVQPSRTIVMTDGDAPGMTEPAYMVSLDHSGSTLDGKPMREGFWRSDAEPDLPDPVIDADWADRDRFVDRLGQLEAQAKSVSFRGFSICRICGCRNGSKTLKLGAWEWPSGYMHYLREHGVRSSASFEMFVDSAFIRIR